MVVSCCCLFEEVFCRFHATELLGEHSLSALSLHFSSLLHRMLDSIGAGSSSGSDPASSLLRTPCHSCECIFGAASTLWRFCWHMIIRAFFKETKNNNNDNNKKKGKKSCIEWKMTEGVFTKFAVRSPGVASWFFRPPPLPGLLLFSYSITLFHLTLPPRKGMQTQKGPIVFNCMH